MMIVLNGSPTHLAIPHSIATLLESLQTRSTGVAVEINGLLVPKIRHADTWIQDGDRIEVVSFVGGG